ncbi:nuclear apoptosis-inducing factor 1-like [Ixodes scapularis]|uniref:nuclear apoptosis-inducing factor 1-like n=1 Tax=Ixodes scapularis TaxID=6945 RepID=UPI001A9DA8BB|nr:nuclear apoptosis-inducing factor 1-like [Ixodes scapularis]
MDVAGPSLMPPKVKKSNWSEDDKFQLVYEIEKRKRVIKNKFNNSITNLLIKKAWQEIASVMNSRHPSTLRTVPQLKKQWQNLKCRSRAELALSKRAHSTTGAGRNDHTLTQLAEAVLAVIGSTSPNLLGIEGGIDTDEASTASVSVQQTTNEVVGEDRVLSYEVQVDPGVAFLEVPESEETLDYEPPDWPLDEDEAPVETGAAAALLRREGPPPAAGGPPEAAAAAEGRPAPLGLWGPPRSRLVWRPSAPPAGSAASTWAADKQFYRDILEQQHENIKLERQCLLAKLKATEEQARASEGQARAVRAACEAAELMKKAANFYIEQGEKMFNLLEKALQQVP